MQLSYKEKSISAVTPGACVKKQLKLLNKPGGHSVKLKIRCDRVFTRHLVSTGDKNFGFYIIH